MPHVAGHAQFYDGVLTSLVTLLLQYGFCWTSHTIGWFLFRNNKKLLIDANTLKLLHLRFDLAGLVQNIILDFTISAMTLFLNLCF